MPHHRQDQGNPTRPAGAAPAASQPDHRSPADRKREVGEASDTRRLKDEWAMTGHAATKKPGGPGPEHASPQHASPPQEGGTRTARGSKGDWDAGGSGQRGPQGDRSESTAGTATKANSSKGRGSTS
ncbi:hypothetical protein [Nitrospirillum sp. BR 11828]|uniref:hypothetical protein n=1 Tax=Nitrospirillum sp. BR 11828 TaxID=3104325 RepID=UPI002ACA7E25|nr:hypothetical protein [Nitrospirillum sp. BR 11828]MDZ5648460.1 hypothetical protein [Nitrospirillum sp. BR 11828]